MFIAIVPAYNEEERIGQVVEKLKKEVDEVVVVDDASIDMTSKVAKDAGATVLRHELNRGQGASLQTGHEYAVSRGVNYVIHFDGDDQFDVGDIGPAMASLKKNNADVLLGSRFLDDRSHVPYLKRKYIHPFARFFHRFFVGLHLSDAHNGFRILNTKALEKIKLTQDRMAHATEIIALIKKNNLKYVEFPVKVVYREYGQGFKGGLYIVKDLFLGRAIKD